MASRKVEVVKESEETMNALPESILGHVRSTIHAGKRLDSSQTIGMGWGRPCCRSGQRPSGSTGWFSGDGNRPAGSYNSH